ncbi:sensor histidine kinase [Blastococcus colisei]|uniref:sensor histidine kinase n=1 Tax=Blastococcus colisei TaxID=1564162 RepID=UPI001476AB73|nr:histidine kinase [Blastococcus colisei]
MPTVARWWGSRSGPERIDVYTRWSFYSWIALTPVLAGVVIGGADRLGSPVWGVAFVAGGVAVAVAGIWVTRAGLAAHRRGDPLPGRPVAIASAAGLMTAAAGVVALASGDGGSPSLGWSVVLPLGMVLTACSTVWATRVLTPLAVGLGVLGGLVLLADGASIRVALGSAASFAAAAVGIVLAFRFTVWVLDVVQEMERSRGVQLQLAVAEERLRFSRDLHDVMGRNLSVISVKGQLAGELMRRQRSEAVDEVVDISRIAEESLRELRDVVRGYRRADLASELAGARSVLRAAGVACTVLAEQDAAALPAAVQTALGWVVREAVTNVLRHSQATGCTVTLRAEGGTAHLRVVNDGVAGEKMVKAVDGAPGSGLTGLAERLADAGGRLEAHREGEQFQLAARVPIGANA